MLTLQLHPTSLDPQPLRFLAVKPNTGTHIRGHFLGDQPVPNWHHSCQSLFTVQDTVGLNIYQPACVSGSYPLDIQTAHQPLLSLMLLTLCYLLAGGTFSNIKHGTLDKSTVSGGNLAHTPLPQST